MTDRVREKLKRHDQERYGAAYQQHCLELYKMYVQTTDNVSSRRHTANSFFLAVNTAVVGLVSYFGAAAETWSWTVSVAGIVLCVTWRRAIRSYRGLNRGKFQVIHEMERDLPFSPFDAEWEALGRGKQKNIYHPFSDVEKWVPFIFGALHLVTLSLAIYSALCGSPEGT